MGAARGAARPSWRSRSRSSEATWRRCSGAGPAGLDRVFGPVERLIYRICRIDPEREQRWSVYALSVLAFSVVGVVLLLYVLQRFQTDLPFNPTDIGERRARRRRSRPRSAS